MNATTPLPAVESRERRSASHGRRAPARGRTPARRALSHRGLQRENREFLGTGGRSEENRSYGFRPAFFDTETRTSYLSRFGNGAPAPCHVLDGLPDALVMARDDYGRIVALRPSVISGFLLDGRFYDREEASQELARRDRGRDERP